MNDIVLTPTQEIGLRTAVQRYNEREPYTCISGYAGTGKSTLVQHIIKALGLLPFQVAYITYTGKAALILQEKGCPNAMTAHKLLYKSYPRSDGTFVHLPRKPLEYPYKLIIVDEISMLPKEMWVLLLSHHIPVIALGDPAQLPPLGEDNGILEYPHIFLSEIMRQAEESEIIRVSMDIRAGRPLQRFKGKEVQIIDKHEVVSGMLTWADQIICATNKTRNFYNDLMRTYKYGDHPAEPLPGDKLICLRNNWDIVTPMGDVLVNGLTGYIDNISYQKNRDYRSNKFLKTILYADFIPDHYDINSPQVLCGDGVFEHLHMDYELLTTHEPTVNEATFRKISRKLRPEEFDYGYAITCHKSQGSEWHKVLVFEESFPRNKEDHTRWLYTAATRSIDKLIIVRK